MVRGHASRAGTPRTSTRSSSSTCRTPITWTAPSCRPRSPSGQGPDLFIISPGDFLRYYNGGVLQDLTPFMEQEAIDDFFPDVLASRIVDGKVYGLPMEVEPMAMYYSLAAWDEAGLTDSDIPADLGAVARGRAATDDRSALRRALRYQSRLLPELHLVSVHVAGRGRDSGAGQQQQAACATPARSQALKFWQDAVNLGVAPRTVLGGGGWNVRAEHCDRLLRDPERRHLGDLGARGRMRPTSSTASSSCRCPRAEPTPPIWAAGPSSPIPRARIRRRRRSSRLGARAR